MSISSDIDAKVKTEYFTWDIDAKVKKENGKKLFLNSILLAPREQH